jgi:hypothetical protein
VAHGGAHEEQRTVKILTRDEILGADDLEVSAEIACPEWGGAVHVRSISGEARDAFEATQAMLAKNDEYGFMKNTRARMVALFACDAEGKRIFSDGDAVALGKKSALALNRVFDVGRKMNGWSKEDVAELEGNSEDAPSDGSGSA